MEGAFLSDCRRCGPKRVRWILVAFFPLFLSVYHAAQPQRGGQSQEGWREVQLYQKTDKRVPGYQKYQDQRESGNLGRKSIKFSMNAWAHPWVMHCMDLTLNRIPKILRTELRDRPQPKFQTCHWVTHTEQNWIQGNFNLHKNWHMLIYLAAGDGRQNMLKKAYTSSF